jgi:hypothetical protein
MDYFICNNTIRNWDIAIDWQKGTVQQTLGRLHFKGNTVLNNAGQGALVQGHNSIIDANYWDNNGASNNRDHALYITAGEVMTNFQVSNNEFRYSMGGCQGVVIVAHGQITGLTIENNLIDGGPTATGGCYGISVGRGYSSAEYFANTIVRRNTIFRTGNVVIEMDASQNPLVENNIIYSPIGGADAAIGVPYQTANTGKGDTPSTGATIRNNTVYIDNATRGIQMVEGTGHVVANNSIMYVGTPGTCFSTTLSAGAFTFAGNNACFGYSSWGATFDTPRVTTNPLFTNPTTDFTPQLASPLNGAGSNTYKSTTDINLKTRPNPPAIGAVER